MSWVKRVPPGDPDYCCNCPPCPFCFVWADEGDEDRPSKRNQPRKARREPSRRRRFVLPLLAAVAFVVTVGITMRHGDVLSAVTELVFAPAGPAVPGHAPAAPQPTVPASAGEALARSSAAPAAPAKSLSPVSPASEPNQPEVPVTLVTNKRVDGSGRVVLRNLSDQPLLVTINVSNASVPNKYMTQVSVSAADVAKLDGVPTAPGDQITLASAGYRDQVILVP